PNSAQRLAVTHPALPAPTIITSGRFKVSLDSTNSQEFKYDPISMQVLLDTRVIKNCKRQIEREPYE
ncbi:MAG: hypothetical protein MUP60_01235, partial [Candidatus Thorarchaeota archaeon]|nr:hypothetical protein [Candidatus Thorarchaeota archaeon]